jgi:hypothetical protein
MRIAVYLRARQPRAVDQAGVVERVRKNRVAGAHQRRHDADVGGVARIKIQRARQAHKGRELAFQRRVGRAVAADQRRSAGPHAIRLRAFTGRLHQGRVRGQAQVVVAAKGQHALAVHRQASAAFRNDQAAFAAQVRAVQFGQARRKFIEPGRRRHCHVRGRSKATARGSGTACQAMVASSGACEFLAQEGDVVLLRQHVRRRHGWPPSPPA